MNTNKTRLGEVWPQLGKSQQITKLIRLSGIIIWEMFLMEDFKRETLRKKT